MSGTQKITVTLPTLWGDFAPSVPDDGATMALGAFIGAWGGVESSLCRLYEAIAGVGHPANIAFQRLSVRDKIDCLLEIACVNIDPGFASIFGGGFTLPAVLSPDQLTGLKSYCSRCNNLSKKRNRIVHAVWGTLDDQSWVRVYDDAARTQTHARIVSKDVVDQKFRDLNCFSVKRIKEFTKTAEKLEEEGRKLANEIRPPPRMIEVIRGLLLHGTQLSLPLEMPARTSRA